MVTLTCPAMCSTCTTSIATCRSRDILEYDYSYSSNFICDPMHASIKMYTSNTCTLTYHLYTLRLAPTMSCIFSSNFIRLLLSLKVFLKMPKKATPKTPLSGEKTTPKKVATPRGVPAHTNPKSPLVYKKTPGKVGDIPPLLLLCPCISVVIPLGEL